MKTERITWDCGHVWYANNTKAYPNGIDNAKSFGCAYCSSKTIRSTEKISNKQMERE